MACKECVWFTVELFKFLTTLRLNNLVTVLKIDHIALICPFIIADIVMAVIYAACDYFEWF